VRQSRRQAGGDAAWRTRRGLQRQDAAFPRSGQVPHRPVRPARQRTLHAARGPRRQHHLDLVADIEKLRSQLGIERWQVFGGSWGSTLALAYAETHPQRVTALVLRGIFMLRRWELEWFYQEGASRLFPDAWEHYISAIPPVERHDLISSFHRRLTSDDEATRLAAARAWSVWEARTLYPALDQTSSPGTRMLRSRWASSRASRTITRQRRGGILRGRGPAAARRAQDQGHPG
jgi:pimeloyl-ACP methyl ester carboxylesterase